MTNVAQQLARHGRTVAKKAVSAGLHVARAGAERALDKAFGDGQAKQEGRWQGEPVPPPGPQRGPVPTAEPAGTPSPAPAEAPEPISAAEAVEAERAEASAWRPSETAASPPDPLLDHIDEEITLAGESADSGAEDGAGADVTVSEPWEGYDQMRARDVVDRLAGADPDFAAAVRLYESSTKKRKTVLEAASRAGRG